MCLNTSKKKFKKNDTPIFMVAQQAESIDIEINIIDDNIGNGFVAIIQYRYIYGNIYDANDNKVVHMIASTDLTQNILYEPTSEYYIDIVVDNTQRLMLF